MNGREAAAKGDKTLAGVAHQRRTRRFTQGRWNPDRHGWEGLPAGQSLCRTAGKSVKYEAVYLKWRMLRRGRGFFEKGAGGAAPQTENELPQPQVDVALGFLMTKREPSRPSR